MKAEIVAIGSELTSGAKLDTNSQWLSLELAELGIPVAYHTTMSDSLEAMIEVFRIAAGRCELVLITGGLGPTLDDITRDALAALEDVELARGGRRFVRDEWTRDEASGGPITGGGGLTCVLEGGAVFEKAGVNFSAVHGTFSPEFAAQMPGDGLDFQA